MYETVPSDVTKYTNKIVCRLFMDISIFNENKKVFFKIIIKKQSNLSNSNA